MVSVVLMMQGQPGSSDTPDLSQLVRRYLQGREFERLNELVELGEEAVPILSEILRRDEWEISRRRAAIALGRLGSADAVEVLGEAAADKNPAIRVSASRALGEVGGDQAEESLLRLLADEDASVRKWAIRSLGKVGGAKAREALSKFLETEAEDFLKREIRGAINSIS